MSPDDDPGWPPGWAILIGLLPGGTRWYMKRRGKVDGVVTLRQLFLSFSIALVWFGVVFAFLKVPRASIVPWLPLLVALAVASVAVPRVVERPLNCATDVSLAGSYRTRFFLRTAFTESVALFGFTFAFIGGGKWIYYLGAAFSLVRFWTHVAPTRKALARDQERLSATGCTRSLVAALRGTAA